MFEVFWTTTYGRYNLAYCYLYVCVANNELSEKTWYKHRVLDFKRVKNVL